MDAVPEPEVVELELPARPEVVSVARLVIGAIVASDPLFDDERGADLRLAVSEACTNAIQAQLAAAERANGSASATGDDLPITMRCALGDGSIEVRVTDRAGGFDPATLTPHPDVTDPARLEYEGGLGIPLIRKMSTTVRYEVPAPAADAAFRPTNRVIVTVAR